MQSCSQCGDAVAAVTLGGTASVGPLRYFRLGEECTAVGNPPTFATNSGWIGYIGETLIYPSTLAGANLSNHQAYLKAKWGTP